MADTYKCSEVINTCVYSGYLDGAPNYCDYLCKVGHSRGCDPEECDKYKSKSETKKRKWNNNIAYFGF